MSKKNRVSRSGRSKKRNGKKAKQETLTFTAPSTGRTITTSAPGFDESMAVVTAATFDAEELTGGMIGSDGADDLKGTIIAGHIIQWFTEGFVTLTKKQIKKGTRHVRNLRRSHGIKSMPAGKKLTSHIVLLWVAPTPVDRAHLMAYILNVSGLAKAIGDDSLQEALTNNG